MTKFKGDDNPGGLFVPAGVIGGMGFGFYMMRCLPVYSSDSA